MSVLLDIIISTLIISFISLIGVFTLSVRKETISKFIFYLVALSAGALLGGAFFHLIPEALSEYPDAPTFVFLMVGFFIFFIIEKVLHWRHCHEEHCEVHSFAYMSLIGDSIHNFLDGLIIAATFVANPSVGIASTLAIALHEIPQEIGDFGVLIYGGFSKAKALAFNFVTAITAVAGGVIGYLLAESMSSFVPFLIPFAAGGFLYIAASDLVPEIRQESSMWKSMFIFGFFLLGILIMFFTAGME